MKYSTVNIPGLIIIEPKIFSDDRGYFMETYQENRYSNIIIGEKFIQDNLSCSKQGVLRGLHYQSKFPQGKLISCIQGEIFDVVVDLRKSSTTCGQYHSLILSEEQKKQLWVPPGFAHGFYVLSEWAKIYYKATALYAPEWERTILWNDSHINIDWPLIDGIDIIVSEKDAAGSLFGEVKLFGKNIGET